MAIPNTTGTAAATEAIGATTLIEPTAIPRKNAASPIVPKMAATGAHRIELPGGGFPAIATTRLIASTPETCATRRTTSTGTVRLFRPPRKSPTPQEMLAASAQTAAIMGR